MISSKFILLNAITSIAQGGAIVSPSLAENLLTEFKNIATLKNIATQGLIKPRVNANTNLSPREEEVLQQLGQGRPNKEIANSLRTSETTVKAHIGKIFKKLHLKNRSQAAAFAANIDPFR